MEQYNILRVVGEGSFGRALLVCHVNSDQKYVMKEIRLPKSSHAVEDSRKEAVLLSKMKHPNIVTFRESFEGDGHLYIVMEYCQGGDLLQKIKLQRGRLFTEQTILQWFVQICLAVQHIHEKRVLHRDIKSKNIFLTQNCNIKLGDFGSARILTSPGAYACTYVGTPYYVPPEIWENMPYNNKSDIWSLGCVLYELCTLKHPFQAGSWKNLILKICQGSYKPLPMQYSYELRSLITQMFRKNPRSRPSASTILSRSSLSKLIRTASSTKISIDQSPQYQSTENAVAPHELTPQAFESRYETDPSSPGLERKQWTKEPSHTVLNKLENASILTASITAGNSSETDPNSLELQRKQWKKEPSDTVLNKLGNASILTSSIAAGKSSDCPSNYDVNDQRKKWKKEFPETLINILQNADLSSAFETYTIYKAKAHGDCLRGPLDSDSQAPDVTDSIEAEVAVDTERFQLRSDDEDTDFEEDDADPDWISQLEKWTHAP
ncbi:NIMA-related kinase 3 S homeolog [Xenopus laevis]|uniref:non-specific serine/threonine protein kinase n=1 Tax=Xenopus laevis TaxID=8355 RepID=Q6INC0_XENLA|nr:NIMA-related kinase 3 S homeolog [Xenopus laevis]AAH72363.1 MGC83541 protein [Xenopus laevis]